jgi:hypothetical protein
MVDDHFPNEKFLAILLQTPWFSYVDNYLTTWRFPHHFSYRERCNIVRNGATYTCIVGYFFNLGQY